MQQHNGNEKIRVNSSTNQVILNEGPEYFEIDGDIQKDIWFNFILIDLIMKLNGHTTQNLNITTGGAGKIEGIIFKKM